MAQKPEAPKKVKKPADPNKVTRKDIHVAVCNAIEFLSVKGMVSGDVVDGLKRVQASLAPKVGTKRIFLQVCDSKGKVINWDGPFRPTEGHEKKAWWDNMGDKHGARMVATVFKATPDINAKVQAFFAG
jgi:hypothetical protein